MTQANTSCKNCGKTITDPEQNFCGRCGIDLERVGSCPVCLQDNLALKPLSCGHSFCKSHCYDRCSSKCPVCRKRNTYGKIVVCCSRCHSDKLKPKYNSYYCENCDYRNSKTELAEYTLGSQPPTLAKQKCNPPYKILCNGCGWLEIYDYRDLLTPTSKCGGCKKQLNSEKLYHVMS